jgi:hypothetical protein
MRTTPPKSGPEELADALRAAAERAMTNSNEPAPEALFRSLSHETPRVAAKALVPREYGENCADDEKISISAKSGTIEGLLVAALIRAFGGCLDFTAENKIAIVIPAQRKQNEKHEPRSLAAPPPNPLVRLGPAAQTLDASRLETTWIPERVIRRDFDPWKSPSWELSAAKRSERTRTDAR